MPTIGPSWMYDMWMDREATDREKMIVSFFIRSALELKTSEIVCSYGVLAKETGIHSSSGIRDSLKRAESHGYITKIRKGIRGQKGKKSRPLGYRVNWNVSGNEKEEKKVRKAYRIVQKRLKIPIAYAGVNTNSNKSINRIGEKPSSTHARKGIADGDGVRVGRFSPANREPMSLKEAKREGIVEKVQVFRTQDTAVGPFGQMRLKVKKGKLKSMTIRDWMYYFKDQYWLAHSEKSTYVGNWARDQRILLDILNPHGEEGTPTTSPQTLKTAIDWLFQSGQDQFDGVSIPLLRSGWMEKIIKQSRKWEKRGRRKKRKTVVPKKGRTW